MEENSIHEKIEKIRGSIEGYELKVKPTVEVLSSLLSVFEERIKRNPSLAIKVGDNSFSERLSETLSAEIQILFDYGELLMDWRK